MYSLLGLLALWILFSPIVAIVTLVRQSRINTRLDSLERNMSARQDRERRSVSPQPAPPPTSEPSEPEYIPEPKPEPFIPPTVHLPAEPEVAGAEEEGEQPSEGPAEETPAPIAAAQRFEENEAQFASRWFIWLGGIALALGGGFLIKYSVDVGLLGPAARVFIATVLGLGALFGGVWLRANPQRFVAFDRAGDRIPAAISAAGLFIAFAAVYGGHALYDLYPSLIAFAGLVIVAGLSVLASIFHGRFGAFIAGLGLLGAYAIPILVRSDEPSSVALFSYLGVLNVASLSLLRWRGWAWLGWGVLIASSLWVLIFMAGVSINEFDALVVALYAGGSALCIALILGTGFNDTVLGTDDINIWMDQGVWPPIVISWIAAAAAAGCYLLLLREVNYAQVPLLASLLGLGALTGLAVRFRTLVPLAAIAGVTMMAFLYNFPVAAPGEGYAAALLPPETGRAVILFFSAAATAFVIGAYMLWRNRPGYWAAVATVLPLGMLTALYLNLWEVPHSFPWNIVAFVFFCLTDILAGAVYRTYEGPQKTHALSAFAVAAVASFTLAAALSLEEAWLTVSLAVQVPALAWIYDRYKLNILRWLAGAVTVAVLVRLVLNPDVMSYPIGDAWPLLNWMWYGYGIPAIAFFLGARWFRLSQREETLEVQLMQAAALGFAVLLATFEVRALIVDDMWNWRTYHFAESTLDAIAWLAIATGLYWRVDAKGPVVFRWGARLLFALTLIHIALVGLIANNPLMSSVHVGGIFFFNLLTLAYLVPGVFCLAASVISAGRDKVDRLLPIELTNVAAFILFFTWLNFMVRHAFHGSLVVAKGADAYPQAEVYTYSAVWLAVAVALIIFGLVRNIRAVRIGALVLLAIVVVKVFLFDMGELSGIFRVISFMGLGIGLLGLGYAYQQFVAQAGKGPGDAGGKDDRGAESV